MGTPVASQTRDQNVQRDSRQKPPRRQKPDKTTEKVSILAGVGYGLTVAVIVVFMINGVISQFP